VARPVSAVAADVGLLLLRDAEALLVSRLPVVAAAPVLRPQLWGLLSVR
jgi:hypothetical protein